MENPARHTRNIYVQNQDEVYVNLFISSELTLENKSVKIQQETTFPASDRSRLLFKQAENENITLHIRVRYWIRGEMKVTVNGKKILIQIEDGYLTMTGEWS